MPISRTYECPDCGGRFRFLHMTRDEPPPAACELCHASFDEVPEAELAMPALGGSALARSVDMVVAQAEGPVRDNTGAAIAPGLQLRDNLRTGEVAVRQVQNPVTQYMAETGTQVWQGASTSAYVQQANAGGRPDNVALRAIQGSRR